MFYKKNQVSALSRALKLLSRREFSVHELSQKLRQYHPQQEIETAISQCIENQWVDDQRFAECYIRTRYMAGYGPRRILLELQQKGITQNLARESLVNAHLNWLDSLRRWIDKKKLSIDNPADQLKLQQFLLRKGFLPDQIKKCLAEKKSSEI